ncbi:mechanosensitive ion channel family protein [Patescibacteria group bacterium]|nr:mechanosensitive ion channel family protein [Patescibacteria group bacterium]MBU1682599.1 mechanosensitive ion channel family protein [Patescibacteria group bacterium]MBU1935662.1 mechanosensitive ion channel family protein [Patescibacteria group bacterium]
MDTIQILYFTYPSQFKFVLFLIGTFVAAHLVALLFKNLLFRLTAKTETELDDELVKMGQRPVYWGVVLGGIYLALTQLTALAEYTSYIESVAKIGFIIILLIVAIRFSRVIFSWVTDKKKMKKKQIGYILTVQKIINAVIYFIAFIFVLNSVGISITPLIASLGIGGLAVGLALQPTLSNYFSGLYVSADGFIKPDDYIELDNGMRGYVVGVQWRNTTIRLWNNNLVKIPNSYIADTIITNYNEPENKSSFIVECGVAYDSNLKQVEKIALEVAEKTQNKKKYGVPDFKPLFRYFEFGDSNINFKVIMQADKFKNHYEMKHEFIRELKSTFDKDGITISFPVRSIEFLDQPIDINVKN